MHTNDSGAEHYAVDSRAVADAVTTFYLELTVRAFDAEARGHDLAVEHAKRSTQFSMTIGAFGPVQQCVATCHVEVSSGLGLLADVAAHAAAGGTERVLAAELAIQFVRESAPTVMSGAQHPLGAIGFFQEHEAAWLFRRVHADTVRLAAYPYGVAESLVEGGRSLPVFTLVAEAEAFRADVRALLADNERGDGTYDADGLREGLTGRGLFRLGWPASLGGRAATEEQRAVLVEEMKYARGPVDRAMSASALLDYAIVRHGTPEQQAEPLPLSRKG